MLFGIFYRFIVANGIGSRFATDEITQLKLMPMHLQSYPQEYFRAEVDSFDQTDSKSTFTIFSNEGKATPYCTINTL